MAVYKNNGIELRRFSIGDLVYEEYYGIGIVCALDRKFDEMYVNFHRPENSIWLTPFSIRNLTIMSKVKETS